MDDPEFGQNIGLPTIFLVGSIAFLEHQLLIIYDVHVHVHSPLHEPIHNGHPTDGLIGGDEGGTKNG
jgi:hypothetical protein